MSEKSEAIAEQVAAPVAAAIEAAESGTTAALEAAAEQVNEAQQTAEAIAAAVLNTELGRQIAALAGELNSCRAEIEELDGEIRVMEMTIEGMEERLSQPQTVKIETATIQPENPEPLTPENSNPTIVTAVEIQPASQSGESGAVQEQPAAPARPKRRFL